MLFLNQGLNPFISQIIWWRQKYFIKLKKKKNFQSNLKEWKKLYTAVLRKKWRNYFSYFLNSIKQFLRVVAIWWIKERERGNLGRMERQMIQRSCPIFWQQRAIIGKWKFEKMRREEVHALASTVHEEYLEREAKRTKPQNKKIIFFKKWKKCKKWKGKVGDGPHKKRASRLMTHEGGYLYTGIPSFFCLFVILCIRVCRRLLVMWQGHTLSPHLLTSSFQPSSIIFHFGYLPKPSLVSLFLMVTSHLRPFAISF